MPNNPFLNFQQFTSKPPRNSVDLSHRYHGTFGLGTLYPVLMLEVDPGDSFNIDSAFGLKFFPMPFPVQTPMRATMHFYYVRTRTLWKDFQDFIYNNKSADTVPHPYIKRSSSDTEFFKTGSLSDYLDVPSTITTDGESASVFGQCYGTNYSAAPVGAYVPIVNTNTMFNAGSVGAQGSNNTYYADPRPMVVLLRQSGGTHPYGMLLKSLIRAPQAFYADSDDYTTCGFMYGAFHSLPTFDSDGVCTITLQGSMYRSIGSAAQELNVAAFLKKKDRPMEDLVYKEMASVVTLTTVATTNTITTLTAKFADLPLLNLSDDDELYFFVGQDKSGYGKTALVVRPDTPITYSTLNFIGSSMMLQTSFSDSNDISSMPSFNPFIGNSPALPISALPYRAYESVFNAWYRNERINPLLVNGVPEYNIYCPNQDSGPDTYDYKLYRRNWEADFLTSCLPTPQQGIAPVVGVAGLTDLQIQDPVSNDIYNFTADIDPVDGETIVGGSFHNPDAPQGVRRTAQDIVTAGFTINDFRNVSALQRWVENNIRRGLKYRDQVLANTGVKVKYDELQMPEFIGGFSRPVQVSSITQTAPGGDLGVGDYAGQANCFGQSKHRISHYCDEAGFIVGILSIVPQPVYSQLLPKHFLKKTALDYHHPAFNHIGMQPVLYDQVCPLQVYASNPSQADRGVKFTDVFGYQRPYYDLLQHVDTVHGQPD